MSQTEHNPFQAPIKTSVKKQTRANDKEPLDFIAIAKKWEWYRLIYNGILILQTIGFAGLCFLLVGPFPLDALAVVAMLGAATVNFFFFLGPAFDGYCQWIFDSRGDAFGLLILVLGTLFSMLLAGGTVASFAAGAAVPNAL